MQADDTGRPDILPVKGVISGVISFSGKRLGKVERHHLAAILARSRALIKRLSTVFVRLPCGGHEEPVFRLDLKSIKNYRFGSILYLTVSHAHYATLSFSSPVLYQRACRDSQSAPGTVLSYPLRDCHLSR